MRSVPILRASPALAAEVTAGALPFRISGKIGR